MKELGPMGGRVPGTHVPLPPDLQMEILIICKDMGVVSVDMQPCMDALVLVSWP